MIIVRAGILADIAPHEEIGLCGDGASNLAVGFVSLLDLSTVWPLDKTSG